jgi:hypothetical protein
LGDRSQAAKGGAARDFRDFDIRLGVSLTA